jgi:hypothetical protein
VKEFLRRTINTPVKLERTIALCGPGVGTLPRLGAKVAKDVLNKSFDKLRMNGKLLIPFVVSLSNHERNRIIQSIPKRPPQEGWAGVHR